MVKNMNEINIEVAKVEINEIKIENNQKVKMILRLSLFDYNDEYCGSIIMDSSKAMNDDFILKSGIGEAIAALFLKIETYISEQKTLTV